MNSLREVKSQFKFLTDTLQDFGTMPIFKRTFTQDLDLLEQHLTKEIISQTDCKTCLTKLRTTFENAFNLEFKERMQQYTRYDAQSFKDAMIYNMDSIGKYMLEIILHQQQTLQLLKQKKLMQTQEDHSNTFQALNIDSLKVNLVIKQNTCSEKEDSNSETASNKSVKESNLDYVTKDVHAIKYKMSKAKERCMAYFRSLHLHLQSLSKEDLKGTRIEHGFKRAFMSLFGQDAATFTNKYFVEYTGIEVKHFKDILLQHMGNVKKSVAERTRHQRQYDRRVNKRQLQTQESKIDTGKAVDADLVVIESSGTKSEVQDDSSRSGNDTNADDAYIRPIYDEEPMAEVQLTTECNIFATGQQHTEQPEIINEENEHLSKENETVKTHYKDLYDSIKIMRSKTIEQTISLLANNADLKAHIQEKVFAIAALKNELRKLKGNSVDTKFAKTSVLGKPVLQSLRNQSVVRQPNAFKSKRHQISKPRFASQVDVKNNLSKPSLNIICLREENPLLQNLIKSLQDIDFLLIRLPLCMRKHLLDLRWKPTGRIFKTVGLRWVPTGKILASCTSKDDSESTHGSNVEKPQTLEEAINIGP
ncbi:hypothetical protein Tco_1548904 [Tanacetum coccineum]